MLCLKAHAKINWTLDILGVRQDGYHLMDMLMQSVELSDTLWLEKSASLSLTCASQSTDAAIGSDELSAEAVPADERNLVYRAALALQARTGCSLGASMQLNKRIPSGAGMGGGSTDAAAALLGLNRLWTLGLSPEELHAIGLSLGADIPFMLKGGLARVSGIGEIIKPLFPAPTLWLTLVQPCDGLSTKEIFTVFDALDMTRLARPDTQGVQEALLNGNLTALGIGMGNVLQAVSAPKRPAIAEAIRALKAQGALCAMMTGSGSVVYGVFSGEAEAMHACSILRERYPYCEATRTCAAGIEWEQV